MEKKQYKYIINKNNNINLINYHACNKLIKLIFLLIIIIYTIFNFYKKYIKIKVCLCTIGKRENLYIIEFVKHYKNLGYNHIFLYDNNDIDNERFDDVLNKYISHNFITIINYRGYRGKRESPQSEAYYDCYEKYNKYYDWLSFFDIDEFLELKPSQKINKFLNNKKYEKCQNIKINWLIYTDNDLLNFENKSIKKRFTKPNFNHSDNIHIKSTVKGKLPINYWRRMGNPHSSINNYISCSPTGKIINSRAFFNNPPDYKFAILNHYGTKTIEEYCYKIKRGRADLKVFFNYQSLKKRFDYFFSINKKTNEKLNIINI